MPRPLFFRHRRAFSSLSEKELLALAISSEEEDSRIYSAYAEELRIDYPESAKIFDEMAIEEKDHCARLMDLFKEKFGEYIPLIRREHVKGFYDRKPDWLLRPLNIDKIRSSSAEMEERAAAFYYQAASQCKDLTIRKLLGDLALEESNHKYKAYDLEEKYTPESVKKKEREHSLNQRLLTWIQPGLAGLMDGSVSTLAPIFAAAFATHNTTQTFLVGLSASIGAGISMGFTEAAHDDGKLSGRGSPWKRGIANGVMTTVGGLGHTLPYLIKNFYLATIIAIIVVFVELWAIVFIQNKFMDTPFLKATIQILLGGILVFASGVLIGSS